MNLSRFTRCNSWVCRYLCVFLAANLLLCCSSSSGFQVPYSDHCSSTVPEYSLRNGGPGNLPPLPDFPNFYHKGGENLFERKTSNQVFRRRSLRLTFDKYYDQTVVEGVYKLEARLLISSSYYYYSNVSRNDQFSGNVSPTRKRISLRFSFMGFWSKSSKKLCMVGSARQRSGDGNFNNLGAVLKLHFDIEKPNILTSVVSGTLASTSPVNDEGGFEPLSLFGFPVYSEYSYSFVLDELEKEKGLSSGSEVEKDRFLSLDSSSFCSVVSRETLYFDLQYPNDCKEHQNCSSISQVDGSWPMVVNLYPIQCSEGRKLRFLIRFQYVNYFVSEKDMDLNSTMIGEGSWVDESNELVVVGCRIVDPMENFKDSVGDCGLRMSLRYPLVWTIKNHAKISGEIWSSKSVDDLRKFSRIVIKSSDVYGFNSVAEVKYEYTELDRVKKFCEVKKVAKKGVYYPTGNLYDLRFDMSVSNSAGNTFAWGNSIPLAIGDSVYQNSQLLALAPASMEQVDASGTEYTTKSELETRNPLSNVSVTVYVTPYSTSESSKWFPETDLSSQRGPEISAEGIYNSETGHLCMVGCRKVIFYAGKSNNDSLDCEILLNFDLPPLNDKNVGRIKGSIRSTRAKGDSFYFDEMSISSVTYSESVAKKSLWRMDLEVSMILISNTLVCIFAGLQLFHMKRNPETVAGISLVMVLILSVGIMIPLVLNFEAMFTDSRAITIDHAKLPEANEVTVRVVTLIAFLLNIRLLQLVWSAKTREGNENNPWPSEIKSIFMSLPVYIVGGLFTLLLKGTRDNQQSTAITKHPLWDYLRCYAGLTLDVFLLPQILFNTFSISSVKSLSNPFYIGTSAIRLVPHAYDQYRAYNFPTQDLNATYYYANPKADFYSTTWDVIIPCIVVLLSVIIFLQQRHGGRSILPRRFRELELYQKVSPVTDP